MDWKTLLAAGRPSLRPATVWKLVGMVAAAQTLVLGTMVWDRVNLLRNGREVTFDVIPVDPRSLFRGDYARLGYEFSRVNLTKELVDKRAAGGSLYVTLRREADGKWKPVATSATAVPRGDAPDQIVLRGRLEHRTWGGLNAVRFGIERFYVPEGTGLELEKDAREKRVSVVVAVDRAGNAAIKRLLVDGKVAASESGL